MAAALGLLVFLAVLFAAAKFVPGREVERPRGAGRHALPLPDQRHGSSSSPTNLVVATGTLVFDLSLAPLIDHFWALFAAANVVSFALAFWLHRRGQRGAARARRRSARS